MNSSVGRNISSLKFVSTSMALLARMAAFVLDDKISLSPSSSTDMVRYQTDPPLSLTLFPLKYVQYNLNVSNLGHDVIKILKSNTHNV